MTTDSLLARYMVITLKGDSVDGQDGRRYAQAGASRSLDVVGQDARRSSQGGRSGAANRIHLESPARGRSPGVRMVVASLESEPGGSKERMNWRVTDRHSRIERWRALYDVERDVAELKPDRRQAIRQQRSRPVCRCVAHLDGDPAQARCRRIGDREGARL